MFNQFYISDIGMFVLFFSLLIGIEVIKNAPTILHTYLMYGASIVGIFLVGIFFVNHRILSMFSLSKSKK